MLAKDNPAGWDSYLIATMLMVMTAVIGPILLFMTIGAMVRVSGDAYPIFLIAYLLLVSVLLVVFPLMFLIGLRSHGSIIGHFPTPESMDGHGNRALEGLADLLERGLDDARRVPLTRLDRWSDGAQVVLQFDDRPSARMHLFRDRSRPGVHILLTRAARGRAADVDRVMGLHARAPVAADGTDG
jgi:hypothetical protein